MASTWVKLAAAVAVIGSASGCALGVRDHRGFVIDKELAQGVQVGVDNKDSVAKTLGRPTFTGQFNDNDWYYVSRDTKTVAFRSPGVLDQTVLRVRFDQAGNVAAIDRTGKELIASIDPSKDKTPTLGREKGFFEELFGNIGQVGAVGTAGRTTDNPQ